MEVKEAIGHFCNRDEFEIGEKTGNDIIATPKQYGWHKYSDEKPEDMNKEYLVFVPKQNRYWLVIGIYMEAYICEVYWMELPKCESEMKL